MAEDLRKGSQKLEIDEDISIVELGLDEALEAVKRNEIRDAKTIVSLLYYKLFLESAKT